MASDLVDFKWPLPPAGGFRWENFPVPGETTTQPCLAPAQAVRRLSPGATHSPLLRENPGLFRTFAAAAPTLDGVLAFANRYGLLGVGFLDGHRAPEPFSRWKTHIVALHRVVRLWDLARAGNAEGLAVNLRWVETDLGPAVVYAEDWAAGVNKVILGKKSVTRLHSELADEDDSNPHAEGQYARLISAEIFQADLWDLLQAGDVVVPAMLFIALEVGDRLKELTENRMAFDADKGLPVRRVVPSGLVGALWLQLAQAVEDDKQFRACETCGTWFDLSADAARSDRVFCSDACRSKGRRLRQERAHELHAEGKSAKAIAEELKIDVDVVKKWLKAKQS